MTAAHKKALAQGREHSRIVDQYLRAISTPKQRGRKVSEATLKQRLANAEARARSGVGLDRVLAAQEARDIQARLAARRNGGQNSDTKALERAFIKIAKPFSDRRGLTYGAWRQAGVSAAVLAKARIPRTRG
jgi:hypothetical protein